MIVATFTKQKVELGLSFLRAWLAIGVRAVTV